MITLSKSGSTVIFDFDNNSGYLQNGTIEVPVNSLSLVIDSSDMVTFKKSASNDIFVSALASDFGMTKAELEAWYKENMVGSTGGGGGGATYTAGDGINIDSGNTISAVYDGMTFIKNRRHSVEGVWGELYLGTDAPQYECCGQFYTAEHSSDYLYWFCFDFTTKTYRVTSAPEGRENDWQNYFAIEFDNNMQMFKATISNGLSYAEDTGGLYFLQQNDYEIISASTTNDAIDRIYNNSITRLVYLVDGNIISTWAQRPDGNSVASGQLGIGGGIVADPNSSTAITTSVKTSFPTWLSAETQSYGCELPSPSSAVKFDYVGEGSISAAWKHGDEWDIQEILDAQGNPTSTANFSVVVSGNTVYATAINSAYVMTSMWATMYSGFDQMVSNIMYMGEPYGTIVEAVDNIFGALDGKQDTLSASTGIEISGNVISATGGGITSGEVQTMIDESISGKVDTSSVVSSVTSASTDSEIPTAKAVFDAIPTGSSQSCTVDGFTIYDAFTNTSYDNTYGGKTKVKYAILDYSGDKTTNTAQMYVELGDSSSSYYDNWVYLDYPNHSGRTAEGVDPYVDITYDSTIDDFIISVPSGLTTSWIKRIYNFDGTFKMPRYEIESGDSCSVIETSIKSALQGLNDATNASLTSATIASDRTSLQIGYGNYYGGSSTYVNLVDIDGSNNRLKTNIQVGTGVSGWTQVQFSDASNLSENPKTPIFRMSGDTSDLANFDKTSFNTQFLVNLQHFGSTWDIVQWDSNQNKFVLTSTWFGENGDLGTATVTYDDVNNVLTVTYPLTAEPYSGVIDEVKLSQFYNQNYEFGDEITKFEYYSEIEQPLRPYVQETRAALGGLKLSHVTQAQFDAMEQGGTLDNSTLYVITDN